MDSAWQVLVHTPWWVFALFIYLLKVGIDATKPSIVNIRKLFILPALSLTVSINFLLSSPALLPLATYALTLTAGAVAGWMLVRNLKLKFDHKQNLVKLPGTFMTLLLILTIFATKYYLGYSIATNPEIVQNLGFSIFQSTVSGLCSGLFLGRLSCYLLQRSQSTHEDLKTS